MCPQKPSLTFEDKGAWQGSGPAQALHLCHLYFISLRKGKVHLKTIIIQVFIKIFSLVPNRLAIMEICSRLLNSDLHLA
jgi:hypothetical protein